jgi:hypothetical protein
LAEAADSMSVVLTQFQLIQNSNWIRIIDEDGSVYEGTVTVEEPVARPLAENEASAQEAASKMELERSLVISAARPGAPATVSPVAGSNAWHFVVSGTNRTVDLPIRLSGLLHSNQAGIALEQSRQLGDPLAQAIAPDEARAIAFTVEGLLRIGTNEPQRLRASQILP